VNYYLTELLNFDKEYPDEVSHVIGTAYFERKNRGLSIPKKMENYVEKNIDNLEGEIEEEKRRRIYSRLSEKGKSAMEVADWEFEKSKAESYGWRDAGPIALSYFRIIELELNQKLILPLIRRCDISLMKELFRNDRDKMVNDKRKKKFEESWSIHIRNLENIKNPKIDKDGLELGWLSYLLASLRGLDDNSQLGQLLRNALYDGTENSIMTEEGWSALNEGLIHEIISEEKCKRYRNPPAHTRYLPYYVAVECRDYVRDAIIKLGTWFY
jgi:hypothetical protein